MSGPLVRPDVRNTQEVVLAGLGSAYRHDDGAGPLVASRVAEAVGGARDVGPLSDPLDLLGLWDGAELAVVIDAVRTGAEPGTLFRIDLDPKPGLSALPEHGLTSTHGIGLAGVLRLARATGREPRRVVLVGIEGRDFSRGEGLSDSVETALPEAIDLVVGLIKESRQCA